MNKTVIATSKPICGYLHSQTVDVCCLACLAFITDLANLTCMFGLACLSDLTGQYLTCKFASAVASAVASKVASKVASTVA